MVAGGCRRLLPSEALLLALQVELSCCAVLGLQMAPFAVLSLCDAHFFGHDGKYLRTSILRGE